MIIGPTMAGLYRGRIGCFEKRNKLTFKTDAIALYKTKLDSTHLINWDT